MQRPRGWMCSAGGEHEEKARVAAVEARPQVWGPSDSPPGRSQQMVSPGSMDPSEGPIRWAVVVGEGAHQCQLDRPKESMVGAMRALGAVHVLAPSN